MAHEDAKGSAAAVEWAVGAGGGNALTQPWIEQVDGVATSTQVPCRAGPNGTSSNNGNPQLRASLGIRSA